VSTLRDLLDEHTSLGSVEVEHLFRLAGDWQLIADLSFADLLLWVAVDPQRIRPAGSEVMRLVCDNSALKAASSWKPVVTIEEGLALTAEWFCDPTNLARYKVDQYNV